MRVVPDHCLFTIRPKGKCTTRAWLGHAQVVSRHIKLREFYTNLMDNDMGSITEHRDTVEHRFIQKAGKHMKQLSQIRMCSRYIQKEKLPLHKCQDYLDLLILTQQNLKEQRGRDAGCLIGEKYIIPNNGLSTDHHFETGVAKIQKGITCEETMNPFESMACQVLLRSNNNQDEDSEESDTNEDFDFAKAVKENERKKKKRRGW